ncbi:MAG TPA: FAD-dependent oxidoreductase [Alphaproteobacteria bacterium]|nr:amine oxidase [Rhodospirillaceae bacterium]HRJ12801.1 FAD-dependent oxidoreductase [Alphaproteobacteria bacterium]
MNSKRKKIAIIGSGISGMGAAHLLTPHHDITVFEKNDYIGGHSRTVIVPTPEGNVPVDTGFIVFNERNYPLLTRLFRHLDVPVTKSDMSFGASIGNGWLEYGTQNLHNIFAQKRNLLRPAFWRMMRDVFHFHARAGGYMHHSANYTMADCLHDLRMGEWFRQYFLLAMGGAIWSTPTREMMKFPASTLIRFFDNHGLLSINDQPQWYTVRGGSREYVTRLTASFQDRIRLRSPVQRVQRTDNHVHVIHGTENTAETFDEVIFACHSDQALAMIESPTADEYKILSACRYQANRAVLHSDISFMPQRKNAWASWVYLSDGRVDNRNNVSLSYWMNNLQPLETTQPMIVTLNPAREPAAELLHDDYWFEHPVFDAAAIHHQNEIPRIQGTDRLWFCGAWQRYGFHEDGLGSAVALAQQMGISPSW